MDDQSISSNDKSTISQPEPTYACADCGKLRTKDEGGTTFTVCEECWDKHYKAPASPAPAGDQVMAALRDAAQDAANFLRKARFFSDQDNHVSVELADLLESLLK